MGVCGKYAKHSWTCALRFKDRVCMRCGLSFWDRYEEPLELEPQELVPSLRNAKMVKKNTISLFTQIVVKSQARHQ